MAARPPEPGKRPTPAEASAICLAACLLELVLLATLAAQSDLTRPEIPPRFTALSMACGVCFLFAVYFFGAIPARFRPALFWTMAVAARLAVLGMHPGDDVWRYLWEGMIQHHGFNPYVTPPDAPALEGLRTAWWPKINHSDWAAIYPPGAEALFRLLTTGGASVWTFRFLFALLDLGTVFLLLRMHVGPARYRDTAWYAWCPLVAVMLVGAVHFDCVMVFLMTAALWALHRANPMDRQPPSISWLLVCGLALGAAIAVKMIPILLLPLLALHLRARAAALLPGLALPVLLAVLYHFPEAPVFGNLATFTGVARTNDLFWWAVDPLIPNPEGRNTAYLIGLAAYVLVVSWIFRSRWRRGALWVIGGTLVLSPILHPWYLTWVLPLAAWRRAYAWFILSISGNAYFLLWLKTHSDDPWIMEPEWRALTIAPPLLWIAFRAAGRRHHAGS